MSSVCIVYLMSMYPGADLEGGVRGVRPLFAHPWQFTYSRRRRFSVKIVEIVT